MQLRFIPAWAGNTGGITLTSVAHAVHPRVGGEHHAAPGRDHVPHGSSPRGRGTLSRRQGPGPPCRFIPAWAGNTP